MAAKLRWRSVPPLPERCVPRRRLLELPPGDPGRLVVLRAGVGYGKRVLAAQWAGRAVGSRWAELTPAGGAAGGIEAELRAALLASPRLVLADGRRHDAELDAALELLLDVVAERGTECVLLIVSARVPAALERWRLAGRARVASAAELAFDRDEAAALLRSYDLGGGEAEIDHLMERTLGWPVAARAYAEFVASGAPRERFAGDQPPLAPYLESEVWGRSTPSERDVAFAVSVVGEADGTAVGEVSRAAGAAATLRRLRERESWLTAAGRRGHAAGPHPLVREFLLSRLAEDTARHRTLRLRAVSAAGARGAHLEAAEHALAAGDPMLACRNLRWAADRAFREGRADRLRACLERFPHGWRDRPELLRIRGYLAWAAGDLPLASALADRAASAAPPDLRAEGLTLGAAVRYARGDVEGERRALRAALDAGARDPAVLGKASYALASLHYRVGALDAAEEELARTAAHVQDDEALDLAIAGLQPLLHLARGRPRAAAEGLRRAVLANRAAGSRRGEAHANYHLAMALGQAGRHERALEAAGEARRLAEELDLAHLAALAAREEADALRDLGSPRAVEAYSEALALLQRLDARAGLLHAHHGLAVLRRRLGDRAGARRSAAEALSHEASGEAGFVALVRLHRAVLEGWALEAEAALGAVLSRPQRYHHALALLYAAALGGPEGRAHAEEAVTLVRHEGFEHLLADEAALVTEAPSMLEGASGTAEEWEGPGSPRPRLYLFGGPEVVDVDGAPLRMRRQGRMLLAYLALARGATVQRQRLAEALWPDRDREMRHALQTLVWLVRRHLGPGAVVTRDRGYAFDPQGTVWVDVEAFTAALRQGRTEEAVRLYRGELLPGVEWAELERRHAEQRYLDALERLAAERLEQGRLQEGVELLERIVALDPLAEETYAKLIACHEASGRHDVARRWSHELSRQLEREFGGGAIRADG